MFIVVGGPRSTFVCLGFRVVDGRPVSFTSLRFMVEGGPPVITIVRLRLGVGVQGCSSKRTAPSITFVSQQELSDGVEDVGRNDGDPHRVADGRVDEARAVHPPAHRHPLRRRIARLPNDGVARAAATRVQHATRFRREVVQRDVHLGFFRE